MIERTTATGEKHGLINTIGNSVKNTDFAHMTAKMKEKCEKQKKEDNKLVKARYINYRGKQERLEKPYCHWAGDPIYFFKLIPGETYEVPMGLVNEINEPNKKLAQRSEVLDINGVPTKKDGAAETIHELVPVSF